MKFIKFWLSVFIAGVFFSCTNYKDVPYFQDLSDTARIKVLKPNYSDLRISPDDILSISIVTLDQSANSVLAPSTLSLPLPSGGSTSLNPASTTGLPTLPSLGNSSGFLVNKDGYIELPVLGKFHLAGLTTMEAQQMIEKEADKSFKKPAVYVRFANFTITVLGEVGHPGTYVIPNEKVTIFNALGLAGDLTIYGKRNNVLLVRDSVNHTQLIRLNLNSKDIVRSPYFYLQKNDVIYVEPNKAKLANLDASQNKYYAIFAAALSVLIIAATRIK